MDRDYEKARSKPYVLIVILLVLAAIPFVLLGIAILEKKVLHTAYVIHFYRAIGIGDPIEALHGWLIGF